MLFLSSIWTLKQLKICQIITQISLTSLILVPFKLSLVAVYRQSLQKKYCHNAPPFQYSNHIKLDRKMSLTFRSLGSASICFSCRKALIYYPSRKKTCCSLRKVKQDLQSRCQDLICTF